MNIAPDKFKDLKFLKQVILPDYHSFYDNLRHWLRSDRTIMPVIIMIRVD